MNLVARVRRSLGRHGVRGTASRAASVAGQRAPRWLRLLHPAVLPGYLDYRLSPRALRVPAGGGWPSDPAAISSELERRDIDVESFAIDVADFEAWRESAAYPADYSRNKPWLIEKQLEHYLSIQLLPPINADSVLIDIGCAGSPFAAVWQRMYEGKIYRQDLLYDDGVRQAQDDIEEIGGNAAAMPLPDASVSAMVLHCSFEMFRGDNDGLLVREAARVLRPGGGLVILPLYLSGLHHFLVDPAANRRGVHYDPGSRIVYRPGFFGVASSRVYSVAAFFDRVMTRADGLDLAIHVIENEKDVAPACYVKFAAVFTKTDSERKPSDDPARCQPQSFIRTASCAPARPSCGK
jgi:SAM-dependent methyltransferase